MSAAGIGSDSGGSVREPAHFSGICALKPTPGRIPGTGHVPGCVGPFDRLGAVGPMTRTVADLKQMFAITAGFDLGDPVSAPVPLRTVSMEELKRVRIGYFEDDDHTPVTSETRGALRQARESLQAQGFEVVEFRPEGLEQVLELWWKFFSVCGAMILGPMLKDHPNVSPILREFMRRMEPEVPLGGSELLEAWIQMDLVRNKVLEQMRQFPVLLCPVCAIPAFKHGEREWQVEGKTVEYFDIFSYTQFFNLLGNPAAVIPVAQSAEGLPIGVQLAGMPWEEEVVIGVAECLERDFGFRPPELAKLA
jgi:amidase